MSAPNPVSLTMIGCGAFARRYHVPALLEDEAVRVAAIFDPAPHLDVHALAQRYGAPVVPRLESLPPASGENDCALVTTPHMLHAAHIDAALDRGFHVLVDKPFVMSTADAERLARRADEAGRINGVAYNRRFDRSCLRAREILRERGIGEVRFVQTVQLGYERAGWFLVPELGGGGPYAGRATHMADLIPWLLGRTPTRLRSRLRASSPSRSDRGGFIEVLFGDLEWQATCIEEGWHMWDEVRIFGDDGLIELRRPLTAPIGWSLMCLSQRGARQECLDADSRPGDAMRDFIAAVRERRAPICTFAAAVPSVALVDAAFQSGRSDGGWIDLNQ